MADTLTPEQIAWVQAQCSKSTVNGTAVKLKQQVVAGAAAANGLIAKYQAAAGAGDAKATPPAWEEICKAFAKAGGDQPVLAAAGK